MATSTAQPWRDGRSGGAGGGPGALVRGGLELVVERLQLRADPVAALQRQRDQVVCEPGVLGQQRPMQVGADQVVAANPLEAVPGVVAVALDDAPERLHA